MPRHHLDGPQTSVSMDTVDLTRYAVARFEQSQQPVSAALAFGLDKVNAQTSRRGSQNLVVALTNIIGPSRN